MEYENEKNNIEYNNQKKHNEVNEIVENNHKSEDPQILLNEDTLKINKINLEDKNEKDNIISIDKNNQNYNEINENISLINIDMEKEKNNQIQQENKNKINIEKEQENEEEEEEDQENSNIDGYLYKCNKEYTDNDNDLHSKRITVKNNNDDYLMAQDENNKNQKDILGDYKNDENEKDEEEEELFPFKIIGDGKKKGETLGKYNSRYFEIDSVKGLFKRYSSSKEYPINPKEII